MTSPDAQLTLGRFISHLHGSPAQGGAEDESWNLERWLEWPPDVFALTTLLFESTGSYLYAASPPKGRRLPHQEDWEEFTRTEVKAWRRWMDGHRQRLPPRLRQIVKLIERHADLPVERLREIGPAGVEKDDEAWEVCLALLDLHCLADAASAAYGIPLTPRSVAERRSKKGRRKEVEEDYSPRHFMANMLLTTRGTLSRLPPSQVVVLPKMRTPRVGVTLRALSHHLTAHRTEVEVIWRTIPWISRDENVLNIVVVPWPYEVAPESFRPVSLSESFGSRGGRYFRYQGSGGFDPRRVVRLVEQTRDRVARVHMVVLPELALTREELDDLKEALAIRFAREKVPLILSGVRKADSSGGGLGTNRVLLSSYFAGKWYDLHQDKHHRWKLEAHQLRQYGLKGLFPGKDEWWEAIRVPARQLTFLSPTGWLTLCPLICEDLARLDPVSPLIRGVGPSLLVAVLLDGPQLQSRWSARYASVLAEDPGTSVLTVSALGMALRGRTPGQSVRRTVAMWKDVGEWKELDVEDDDHGLLLSVRAEMEEESTLDGRSDRGNAAVFRYQGHWRLRVPEEPLKPKTEPNPEPEVPKPEGDAEKRKPSKLIEAEKVDLEELSRFTHLVDNAIALVHDDRAFTCLFALARRSKGPEVGEPWFGRCRYAEGLWSLVQEELDELYERQRPGSREEYHWLLEFLRLILDGARRGTGSGDSRALFQRLVHLARGALQVAESVRRKRLPNAADAVDEDVARVIREELPDDLQSVLDGAYRAIEDAPRGRIRIPLITFLAILWAIHRGIVPPPRMAGKQRPPLDDVARRLLRSIEELLGIDYWRYLAVEGQEAQGGDRVVSAG